MSMTAAPRYNVSANPDPGSQDPWAALAAMYGLGAPPAPGLPATLPGIRYGNAPELQTNNRDFMELMNLIAPQISGSFGATSTFNPTMLDTSKVPQVSAQQFGESDQLKQLLSGIGYSPDVMASLRASAVEGPAQAGVQQLGQMKRAMQENGISGGASVGMRSDLARQVGQQQTQGLRDVDITNANVGNENRKFGVGQQTTIGLSNMQSANQMAMQSANMMMQALLSNQNATNAAGMNNAQMENQTNLTRGSSMANFYGQQASQAQGQRHDNELQNANMNWQRTQLQGQNDWDRQKSQWDELNKRYGQSQNILGQWSAGG